jgi:hypothetical protein
VPKFTGAERTLVKSLVASLTIKRMIMNEILQKTSKTISSGYIRLFMDSADSKIKIKRSNGNVLYGNVAVR